MTLAEIRKEYGSLKAACQWLGGELRMSKRMAAAELGVAESTFHGWLGRFNLHQIFPPGGKERHDCRGKEIPRPGAGNRTTIRLSRRKPIKHNGTIWHPGEPTHHYLYQLRKNCTT